MVWRNIDWSCGHDGRMQLYGPYRERDSRVAFESGRKCMSCWLVEEWEKKRDPRSNREDRYLLGASIAGGKGIEISVPSSVPVKATMLSEKKSEESVMI